MIVGTILALLVDVGTVLLLGTHTTALPSAARGVALGALLGRSTVVLTAAALARRGPPPHLESP